MPAAAIVAAIGSPTSLRYPSDDLSFYQVGTDLPLYQQALGDLPPAAGNEAPFAGLRRARHTRWTGTVSGARVVLHIMCSPTNTYYLAGPGSKVTVGGITFTCTACVGEQRSD